MSSIRTMTAVDLLSFADCNLDPLTETYGIEFYLEYLAKWPQCCYVLLSPEDCIEGYILGKLESSPHLQPTAEPYDPDTNKNLNYLPWHAHVTALTVAPHMRRLGHAHKLTQILEVQGDEANAWFVDLFVRADNVTAIKLYKSMGYSVFRRVVGYYADGADAFDMRKPLKRDVDRKHIREDGENFCVDPDDVWNDAETFTFGYETSFMVVQNRNVLDRLLGTSTGPLGRNAAESIRDTLLAENQKLLPKVVAPNMALHYCHSGIIEKVMTGNQSGILPLPPVPEDISETSHNWQLGLGTFHHTYGDELRTLSRSLTYRQLRSSLRKAGYEKKSKKDVVHDDAGTPPLVNQLAPRKAREILLQNQMEELEQEQERLKEQARVLSEQLRDVERRMRMKGEEGWAEDGSVSNLYDPSPNAQGSTERLSILADAATLWADLPK